MKKTLGILFASVVLASSAACGGSSSSDPAEAAKSDAKVAAEEAGGSGEMTRDNFVERLTAAQMAAGTARMEMTMGVGSTEMVMTGDVKLSESVEDTATQVSMDMGTTQMEIRVVDGFMYVKMGEMTGGKFIRIDLKDKDNRLADQYGTLTEQMDPAEQLEVFRSALVSFENQGDGGEIDGVDTTKLRLVLDTDKALGDRAGTVAESGAELPEEIEYTLFVGSDDLMRRMDMELAGMTSTIMWSRWGEPVTVEVPAESEITEMDGLMPPTAPRVNG